MAWMMLAAWLSCLHGAPGQQSDALEKVNVGATDQALAILPGS
jgi:hypothetical protein